jgi:hypothetical protein
LEVLTNKAGFSVKKELGMKKMFVVAVMAAAVAVFSGCENGSVPGPETYTITVSQGEGGTVSADPSGGKAGTLITLSNVPGEYGLIHYTVDGVPITGSAFILNKDVTVRGVFGPQAVVYAAGYERSGEKMAAKVWKITAGGEATKLANLSDTTSSANSIIVRIE